jgi:hypothetical protein
MMIGVSLDRSHPDNAMAAALRAPLIRLYGFLSAYPKLMWSGSEKAYSEGTIWDAADTTKTQLSKSHWFKGGLWLLAIIACSFAGGRLADAVFKPSADTFITKENAWWWGFFGGLTISIMFPLLLWIASAVARWCLLLPVLVASGILLVAQRTVTFATKRASSPLTAPFSYLGVLLSSLALAFVLIAAGM